MKIVDQIPDEIIHQLKTVQHIPKENELIGITKEGGTRVNYGYYTMTGGQRIKKVWLDSLHYIHDTLRYIQITPQHTLNPNMTSV